MSQDPTTASAVELRGVAKRFGQVTAVHPTDLAIGRGEFVAILGPSGCGKTTLLQMIGGFLEPSEGKIFVGGKDVTRIGPEHRPTNMVFQGYGLFPHMTVAQNIGYGLRIAKAGPEEIGRRVSEIMDLVHLEGLGGRMASELSGGQQQRTALARALVMRPQVLLLDEPLAALDLKLRKSMQEELRRIHRSTGGTFIFVTHDQEEAMGLATTICVMQQGRIVQQGLPEEIYSTPSTRFVSAFIGEANLLKGTRARQRIRLDAGAEFAGDGGDGGVIVLVRPEKIGIVPQPERPVGADFDVALPGTLVDAVFLGPYVKYSVRLRDETLVQVHSRDMALRRRIGTGAPVIVGWRFDDHQVLAD